MIRICPIPLAWVKVHEKLRAFTSRHRCMPPEPPLPLVLGGWAYSNDQQKRLRWLQTIEWAQSNGCPELTALPESDFYWTHSVTSYTVGPMGGPMYREWDSTRKVRPSEGDLKRHIEYLSAHWPEVAGNELADICRPARFTGAKARRLVVQVIDTNPPPWGSWHRLSRVEAERRTFTRFRASVNRAINPHEVDHIDFTSEM